MNIRVELFFADIFFVVRVDLFSRIGRL